MNCAGALVVFPYLINWINFPWHFGCRRLFAIAQVVWTLGSGFHCLSCLPGLRGADLCGGGPPIFEDEEIILIGRAMIIPTLCLIMLHVFYKCKNVNIFWDDKINSLSMNTTSQNFLPSVNSVIPKSFCKYYKLIDSFFYLRILYVTFELLFCFKPADLCDWPRKRTVLSVVELLPGCGTMRWLENTVGATASYC